MIDEDAIHSWIINAECGILMEQMLLKQKNKSLFKKKLKQDIICLQETYIGKKGDKIFELYKFECRIYFNKNKKNGFILYRNPQLKSDLDL